MKDGKKRDKDAKKARKDQEKAAEEEAERAYQASKKTRTPDAPRAAAPSTRIGPKNRQAQDNVQPVSDEEVKSASEHNSADDYESGNEPDIPIDPVLLGKARARESSGEEEQQPAKKKSKAVTGGAMKPAPTPAKKPKGPVNVTVGVPQALQETTASKKKLAPIALSSDSSSSDESSETSDSDTRKRAPIGPHTPYKAPAVPRGKNAPILRDLTPTTKSITEDARTKYAVYLATEDAFPNEKNARKTARKLFIAEIDSAAHDDDDDEDEDAARRERRGERAKADKTYREHVNNMVTGVDSSFRGHVVDDAVPLVEHEYGLITGELDEAGVADRVGHLLEDGSFTFKDWEQRDGAFQCPILPKLLRKAFLTKQVKKGHALGLGPNFHTFSEVSPPLLAFLLTAIECVLRRWQTGKYELSHFTMTKYEPIYSKHLEALHQTEVTSPGTLSEIRKGIWATACKTAGIAAPTKVRELDHSGGYMRPADLAKMRSQQPNA